MKVYSRILLLLLALAVGFCSVLAWDASHPSYYRACREYGMALNALPRDRYNGFHLEKILKPENIKQIRINGEVTDDAETGYRLDKDSEIVLSQSEIKDFCDAAAKLEGIPVGVPPDTYMPDSFFEENFYVEVLLLDNTPIVLVLGGSLPSGQGLVALLLAVATIDDVCTETYTYPQKGLVSFDSVYQYVKSDGGFIKLEVKNYYELDVTVREFFTARRL